MSVKSIAKKSIKAFILLCMFIKVTFVFAQEELRFTYPSNPSKQLVLKERNLVVLKYADIPIEQLIPLSGKNKRKLHTVEGRITSINDSTISIRKIFSKKIVTIPLENIYQIKKESAGQYIVLVVFEVATIPAVVIYGVPPHFAALAILPPVYLYNLLFSYKKLKYPYKNKIIEVSTDSIDTK